MSTKELTNHDLLYPGGVVASYALGESRFCSNVPIAKMFGWIANIYINERSPRVGAVVISNGGTVVGGTVKYVEDVPRRDVVGRIRKAPLKIDDNISFA